MSREADNVIGILDVIDRASNPSVVVSLVEKNRNESGAGTALTGTITTTSTGRDVQTWTGVKELVRYKFKVNALATSAWALFRMLPPIWYDDVEA